MKAHWDRLAEKTEALNAELIVAIDAARAQYNPATRPTPATAYNTAVIAVIGEDIQQLRAKLAALRHVETLSPCEQQAYKRAAWANKLAMTRDTRERCIKGGRDDRVLLSVLALGRSDLLPY